MIKLYGCWRSSATWRVRAALCFKNIPFSAQVVDVAGGAHRDASYAQVHPLHQVPTLELESGARLTQSVAILHYLETVYPEPALLPPGPLQRAQVLEVVETINAGVQPLQNTGVQRYVEEALHGDGAAWARHWVSKGMGALEVLLASRAGKYCVGDALSWADVCLVPQVYFCGRIGITLDAWPTVTRVAERCASLDAFVRSHPDAQPDAPRA